MATNTPHALDPGPLAQFAQTLASAGTGFSLPFGHGTSASEPVTAQGPSPQVLAGQRYVGIVWVAKKNKYRARVRPKQSERGSLPDHLSKLDGLTAGYYALPQDAARAADRILHKLGRAETNGLLSADEKAEVDAMSWEALMEGHTMVWNSAETAAARPVSRGSSSYRGVAWNQSTQKWMSRIDFKNKQLFLGCYGTQEEAARAYDKAAHHFHGAEATLNFKNEPPSPPDPELLARLQGQYKRPHPSTRGTGSMSTGRGAPGQHTLMGQQLPGSFLAGAGLDGAGGLLGQLCDALNVLAGGSQRQDGRGSQAFDGSHAFGGGQQFDAGRATAGAAQDAWLGSLQQPGQQLQQQLQHLLHYQPSAQPATQAPPQQQQLQRAQPPTLFLSLLEEAFEEEGERGEGPTATPQGAGVDAGLDGWAGAGEAGMARSADPPGSSQAQQRQEQQQQQQERSDRTSDTPQLCAVQAAGASEVTGADTDAGVSVAATPGDAGASASEAATEVSAGQAARVVLALSCQSQPDAGQEGYQIEPAAGSAGYQSAAGAPGEATQREAWQQGREEAGPAGMDAEDDVELAGRGEGLERMAWEAAMLWEGQRVYLGQFGCDSEVLPAYERALEYLHASGLHSVDSHVPLPDPPEALPAFSAAGGSDAAAGPGRSAQLHATPSALNTLSTPSSSGTGPSGFRGVRLLEGAKTHPWQARLVHKGRCLLLGRFRSEAAAARAHDCAAHFLMGRDAVLNFPSEKPALPTVEMQARLRGLVLSHGSSASVGDAPLKQLQQQQQQQQPLQLQAPQDSPPTAAAAPAGGLDMAPDGLAIAAASQQAASILAAAGILGDAGQLQGGMHIQGWDPTAFINSASLAALPLLADSLQAVAGSQDATGAAAAAAAAAIAACMQQAGPQLGQLPLGPPVSLHVD